MSHFQPKSAPTNSNNDTSSPWSSWISMKPSTTVLIFGIPRNYGAKSLAGLLKTVGLVKSVEKVPEATVALADFANLRDAESFVNKYRDPTCAFHVDGSPVSIQYSKHRILDKPEADKSGVVLRLDFVPNSLPHGTKLTAENLKSMCQTKVRVKNVIVGPSLVNEHNLKSRVVLIELENHNHALTLKQDIFDQKIEMKFSWNMNRITFSALPTLDLTKETLLDKSPLANVQTKESPKMNGDVSFQPAPSISRPRTCVLHISNLDMDFFNCDKLFNLLSMFGKVILIKFLHNSLGTALAQMDSPESFLKALENVNGMSMRGKTLSAKSYNSEVSKGADASVTLPSGAPSYKEFTDEKSTPSSSVSVKDPFLNSPMKPVDRIHTEHVARPINSSTVSISSSRNENVVGRPCPTPLIYINGLDMNVFHCDLLCKILSPHGRVIRIKFILKRPGVAMVEMDSVESANNVFQNLNKKQILYSDLKVVPCNKTEVFCGADGMLPLPTGAPSFKDYTEERLSVSQPLEKEHKCHNDNSRTVIFHGSPSTFPSQCSTPVVLIHNLDADEFDCDSVYSLVREYGTVIRVKFNLNRPGSALVQMDSAESANQVVEGLNGVTVMGLQLRVKPCSSEKIFPCDDDGIALASGAPSCKDFVGMRFSTPSSRYSNTFHLDNVKRELNNVDSSIKKHCLTNVVYVNHLNMDVFQCDYLWNLVSRYGTVNRIKFLHTRPGVAMVEMNSPECANNLIQNLSGKTLFGGKLLLIPCKQERVERLAEIPLSSGEPSFKDYTGEEMEMIYKRTKYHYPPSTKLSVSNVPPGTTKENFMELFRSLKFVNPPVKVEIIQGNPGLKNLKAFMEFSTLESALEAVVLLHNKPIHIKGLPHPFHLKVMFYGQ